MTYAKDGFCLFKNYLKVDVIYTSIEKTFRTYANDADTNLDDLIYRLYKDDYDGFLGCANLCQHTIPLWKATMRISRALAVLGIERPTINTRPLLSFSSSKLASHDTYWKVPPHQDWPSMQGSINAITCWCPLRDVEDEMGPLEVSPGTHLLGPLTHVDEIVPVIEKSIYSFEKVPMNAGDALFFSTFLVHKSGINKSNKIRLSMHCRFDDANESTFISRKFPRHRIDERKKGILFPGFPTKEQVDALFNNSEQ